MVPTLPPPRFKSIFPVDSNFACGEELPTPTFPVLVSTYKSLVLTAKSPVVDRLRLKLDPAAGVTVRAPEAVVIVGVTTDVPKVPVVPIFKALAAEIPPEVRMAPVIELVVSRVEGANSEAEAPVPPMVRRVVAPAKAVKEVDGVVIEVVIAGEVIDCTPVNV